MNISTGGPHILLFERDQQLTALFMSEFQLAGYECHTARTAVEVFDAIARFPVRLVLVNLAQAAASRREFWVALDTQRRGRGVQVLTFTCTNLAGYGPQDTDERSQTPLADMQVDGMLGLMALVDAVRARVPGSGAATNPLPRLSRSANPSAPVGPASPVSTIPAPAVTTPPLMAPPMTAQTPGSVQQTNAPAYPNGPAYRTGMTPDMPNTPLMPNNQSGRTGQPSFSQAAPVGTPPVTTNTTQAQQSYTDKIRAVLYPNQRNWSGTATQEATPATTYDPYSTPDAMTQNTPPAARTFPASDSSMLQRLANGQAETEEQNESGLAQLSRMVQASRTSTTPAESAENLQRTQTSQTHQPFTPTTSGSPSMLNNASVTVTPSTPTSPTSPQTLPENGTLSVHTLRASPIQDLPIEKGMSSAEENRRAESHSQYGLSATTATPLASITMPMPAVTRPIPVPEGLSAALSATPAPMARPTAQAAPSTPTTSPAKEEGQQIAQAPTAHIASDDKNARSTHSVPGIEHAAQELTYEANEDVDDEPTHPVRLAEEDDEEYITPGGREIQGNRQSERLEQEREESRKLPNNALLLDIVQSLPPMPSPPPMQQALQGRATRSLGSVLLEGHLVPQSRLEVAQNIQRMLRGVDLNYQLGEILLMFKLLTPDQLLAASLVSYGLITTQQIVALGRIRQELHAIGLEYDLENLLILFRILSPDQLREVRSSWQS